MSKRRRVTNYHNHFLYSGSLQFLYLDENDEAEIPGYDKQREFERRT